MMKDMIVKHGECPKETDFPSFREFMQLPDARTTLERYQFRSDYLAAVSCDPKIDVGRAIQGLIEFGTESEECARGLSSLLCELGAWLEKKLAGYERVQEMGLDAVTSDYGELVFECGDGCIVGYYGDVEGVEQALIVDICGLWDVVVGPERGDELDENFWALEYEKALQTGLALKAYAAMLDENCAA